MGFKISGEANNDKKVPAPDRLFLTAEDADGNRRLVSEGDPEAAVLFSPYKGYLVDRADLEKFGGEAPEEPKDDAAGRLADDGAPVPDEEEAVDFGAKKGGPRGRKR